MLFYDLEPTVRVYQLNEDGPGEEMDGDDEIATYKEWVLPSRDFHGLWESLVFDTDVKRRLTSYAANALLFSQRGVNPNLVAWNRVVLLHGPPGTGKTTLCKALAQQLAIRFQTIYPTAVLVEVNAHSLFSRWFSESGKLVSKLFGKIQELLDDEGSLVFVLIDEVESLAAARKAAAAGAEPSDAIRVVNALLTQVDGLKSRPNSMVLTTSNITEAIDLAFVDRADIKAYIGPPGEESRYEILRSAVEELCDRGLVQAGAGEMPQKYDYLKREVDRAKSWMAERDSTRDHLSGLDTAQRTMAAITATGSNVSAASIELAMAATTCEGLSGRALRKLPFLAYAVAQVNARCPVLDFVRALSTAAESEFKDRETLKSG